MSAGRRWTRDELLIALNLYRKLTFGQMHGRNPAIVALAEKLDRTSNSVAMKLCNFASLDPNLQQRGLEGASELDRTVWKEFSGRESELAPQSEDALRRLFGADENEEVEVVKDQGISVRRVLQPPTGPTERMASVKVRRSQSYFRQVILNAFDWRCCVTGNPVPELLVASHILPWGKFENERVNPQNGLCLSTLHDAAFDGGLITFDEDRRLVLSRELKSYLPHETLDQNFTAFQGKRFNVPADAPPPKAEFLAHHREHIFEKVSRSR